MVKPVVLRHEPRDARVVRFDVESAVSEDARETGVRLQGWAPVSMVARAFGEDNLCYKDAQ